MNQSPRFLRIWRQGVCCCLLALTLAPGHGAEETKGLSRAKQPTAKATQARKSVLGTALFPANYPRFTQRDLLGFFDLAASMGNHVFTVSKWTDPTPTESLRLIMSMCHAKGLKFHLYLDAIALDQRRDHPAVPQNLKGKSLADPEVRAAFRAEALRLAQLKPDMLGLSTEVNLLAVNPREFESFVSLERETYQTIKATEPGLLVTVSFQWDVLRGLKQFELLKRFSTGVDTYSFTSYPQFHVKGPNQIPNDYFAIVRKYLPTERLGFSEIGWSATTAEDEETQASFFARLPELFREVRPEYLTLAMLHDVQGNFPAGLEYLGTMGVRRNNGTPKRSWELIRRLPL